MLCFPVIDFDSRLKPVPLKISSTASLKGNTVA